MRPEIPDTFVQASREDAPALAFLINHAYEVERFFVDGDRTSPSAIREAMASGIFLVGRDLTSDIAPPAIVGCVFVETRGDRATFGMLAVAPEAQGRGLGYRLIRAAEAHARAEGCSMMAIRVVNLRDDLLAYYRRLGYVDGGVEPYSHRPVTRRCHFVLMRKSL